MKQILLICLLLTALIFTLPLLTVGGGASVAIQEQIAAQEESAPAPPAVALGPELVRRAGDTVTEQPEDNLDESLMMKVLIGDTVAEMNMFEYLCGVMAAEMPAEFPPQALRAQAIAARTYAANKRLSARGAAGAPQRHKGADICDDYHHCLAYIDRATAAARWGDDAQLLRPEVEAAVRDTDGLMVTYESRPIVAIFFDTSSGVTENARDLWGEDIPYLQGVASPGEEASPGYAGQVTLTTGALRRLIRDAYPDARLEGAAAEWFGPPSYTDAGGVRSLPVGGVDIPGTKLRELCGLRSTHFTISFEGDDVVFDTVGYGHGVGMSQYGAKMLADRGLGFEEILKWYYTGVEVERYPM